MTARGPLPLTVSVQRRAPRPPSPPAPTAPPHGWIRPAGEITLTGESLRRMRMALAELQAQPKASGSQAETTLRALVERVVPGRFMVYAQAVDGAGRRIFPHDTAALIALACELAQ